MKKAFHIRISGTVQGVGFRPFVYNLARDMQLFGYVINTPQGVTLHVEGEKSNIDLFLNRLNKETPSHSHIIDLQCEEEKMKGYQRFKILKSNVTGEKRAFILPDLATCDLCLDEIFDPENRRYRYPFTNCTQCGPRYSIIESLPYDRGNTSMKIFTMCPDCASEYADPGNRRFHAQPNACPSCGPHTELWDQEGNVLGTEGDTFDIARAALQEGKILALKGIGGFQLLCDARNKKSVQLLRHRKNRPDKPFALLYPDEELVKRDCYVSPAENELLLSPGAPIVLLIKKQTFHGSEIAENIAPDNSCLGVMLPYSPLHHILMKVTDYPLVATSGNLTNEPICIDEAEALNRLRDIADLFLVHNRPIVRPVDDSVVRVIDEGIQMIRCARGYAPQPVLLSEDIQPMIALGAHLKNSVSIGSGHQIFLSQHIGNLETPQAFETFQSVLTDFQKLYDIKPVAVTCDHHPGYLSTQYARTLDLPVIPVQHHHSHIMAAVADNDLREPVLGVSWDGTGYGMDGTIWGGEFLLCEKNHFERVAHFRTFPLPGGETAIKDPRRTVLGILYEMYGEELKNICTGLPFLQKISRREMKVWLQMLKNNLHSPYTSSVGRLFDGVASILDLRNSVTFEGQAAIHLEHIIEEDYDCTYPIKYLQEGPLIVDWQPTIESIMDDVLSETPKERIASQFHNTLTEIIIKVASKMKQVKIVLSGGCFQNRYLTERTIQKLRKEGYKPYINRMIPSNDGGIAIGQMIIGYHKLSDSGQSKILEPNKQQKI